MAKYEVGMPLPLEKTGNPKYRMSAQAVQGVRERFEAAYAQAGDALGRNISPAVFMGLVALCTSTGMNIGELKARGERIAEKADDRHVALAEAVRESDGLMKAFNQVRLGAANAAWESYQARKQAEAQEDRNVRRERVGESIAGAEIDEVSLAQTPQSGRLRR